MRLTNWGIFREEHVRERRYVGGGLYRSRDVAGGRIIVAIGERTGRGVC